jgi:hypothetical protein
VLPTTPFVVGGLDGRVPFDQVAFGGVVFTGKPEVVYADLGGYLFVLEWDFVGEQLHFTRSRQVKNM